MAQTKAAQNGSSKLKNSFVRDQDNGNGGGRRNGTPGRNGDGASRKKHLSPNGHGEPMQHDIASYFESSKDLKTLKILKKTLTSRIKVLLGDKPEKSFKKRIRNGREYWYEVWWDPVEKKKKDKYLGTSPPDGLVSQKT